MKLRCFFAGAIACMVAQNALGEISFKSLESPHVAGEMIVTFQDGTSEQEVRKTIEDLGATILHKFRTNTSFLIKASKQDRGFLEVSQILSLQKKVKKVATNRIFTINAMPDDPKLSQQYHHKVIQSQEAWDITTGNMKVVAAIIDTGVTYDHPDLEENYWANPGETGRDKNGQDKRTNGRDDDGNGYIDDHRGWDFADNDNDPMDEHGHGTHCAGSIGARGDNGVGISGISWNVSIVGLKFIGKKGEGSEADAIKAVEYATMMGFDVTSNSWGGDATDSADEDLLYEAIKASGKAGILFIAAAGNDGRNTDKKMTLPAGYTLDNIISVGASDSRDRMSSFSNYGLKTVDLMAPGSAVFSTTKPSFFGQEYGSMSGTSMAAPIVAGAVALLMSEYPDESASDIKSRILNSVDEISAVKTKLKSGGRLNVYRALTL